MPNVYRINTRTKSIAGEDLKKDYLLFGNRGLVAKVLSDEVNPACDPLGAENKLIICTGIFAGTPVPGAHKFSIGGKSPLTGGIKESNVGGNAGYQLARHGIRMLVFEDLPADDKWYLLKVNKDSTVELVPADEYVGLNTYALSEKLYAKYGKDIAIIAIGTAGERKYNIASVMVSDQATGHPCRAAGRGGMGAVMGSKHIKAVVIEKAEKKYEVNYVDKEKFMAANKKYIDFLTHADSMKVMTEVGTIGAIDIMGSMAIMPVKNFRGGFFDKIDGVNTKAFLTKLKENGGKNGLPCQPGCVVRCNNIYCNSKGEYVTGSLEYETVVLLGPNCDIANLDFLAEMDRLCDDLGVDSMEVGNIVAVCMEAGKIAWGDEDGTRKLIMEMVEGTEFGRLMGKGTAAVGKALGVQRVPAVKGQAISAYDPRNLKGMGVTYATSPMGADHTAGHTFVPGVDHMSKVGQVNLSGQLQMTTAMVDNMGCMFNLLSSVSLPDVLPNLMAGLYGGDWDLKKVIGIGVQTLMLEKAFNKAAGFTDEDDRLPEFFYKEKALATGTVFDITSEEIKKVFPFPS
ncbi:aldehyde ferredoxin oxidoreductase C-terminal domain-containing protein [Moorella sulfitireducens]|uniref:aldehyde ferredoxin oxidoreductase C-terminal domain-containing protein n=1 Tax=Neomoorella sulfitireducens TaxID=2972948 RepID=UPI0021AC4607|nr:aldehyde ferredoxin oxidoreductase C-terminal domain-containing protein [Moorella sulfitireducens]